jgi:hypothetical protein
MFSFQREVKMKIVATLPAPRPGYDARDLSCETWGRETDVFDELDHERAVVGRTAANCGVSTMLRPSKSDTRSVGTAA